MKAEKQNRITLKVSDMHCGGCAATVEKALSTVAGVKKVKINLRRGEAQVTVGPDSRVDTKDLIDAVKSTGYGAEHPEQA
jgi:copper chaperone CopZ